MPLIDFAKYKKTYEVNAVCMNCGVEQLVSIPKGSTIEEFFKGEAGRCQRCGCVALHRKAAAQR